MVDPPVQATPAIAFSKAAPRQDVFRRDAFLQQINNNLAAFKRDFIFAGVHGGNSVESHGREADQLHHRRHRVGRVLSAARACARARDIFEFEQLGVGHLAGSVCADRFEHILNGDVFAAIHAGRDRAAVEHEAGEIHAGQRHGGRRDGLVAAYDADDGVEELAAADQFDRIGNDFAADQRGLHAFGAHGFAVADGDGIELHGRAARGANAFLHLGREAAQVEVAGHGFDPGVGDADERLAEIVVGEADRLEHGARRSAVAPVGDTAAAMLEIHRGRRLRQGSLKGEIRALVVLTAMFSDHPGGSVSAIAWLPQLGSLSIIGSIWYWYAREYPKCRPVTARTRWLAILTGCVAAITGA